MVDRKKLRQNQSLMDVEHWKTGHDIFFFFKFKGICNDFILYEQKALTTHCIKGGTTLSLTGCRMRGVEKWEEYEKGGCL